MRRRISEVKCDQRFSASEVIKPVCRDGRKFGLGIGDQRFSASEVIKLSKELGESGLVVV